MTTQPTALEQLKGFLNKLFQFESQDLDFGIYRILHYKRSEIKEFIDKLLVDKVQEQLRTFSSDELNVLKAKAQELEQDDNINNYLQALGENPQEADILYKYNKAKIDQYKSLKKQLDAAHNAGNAEELIYNNLTQFFSRYYDKGDFISKRRYGKSDKYVVPYNGEETHFYWANHDQYYIKSSEFFQNFSFKQPHSSGTLKVHFKLTEAATEQGNVKAEKNKYFILSGKAPELEGDDLNVYFEFRPLHESEEKETSGNNKQETLNANAAETLKSALLKQTITAGLWAEDEEGHSVLLRKLNQYTRKNSFDFFIHKDLKGFLQRELDYYIKTELVQVDDLYVLDSEQHFENIRHNFKLIKSFKLIADTIIEFLAQIENFQKQLWEKKKFVLSTEWVITLDKLTEWLEPAAYEAFITAALQNQQQLTEWKNLFGAAVLPRWEGLTIDDLKADLHTWRKLPVDTAHYSPEFKLALLTALSEKINLEEEANGLVINSDNFHGLTILQEKFHESIRCVHIDPPYNTDTGGFLYKNSYRRSSWLSMIENRIKASIQLLDGRASLLTHIDEYEHENLYQILQTNKLTYLTSVIWDKKNPMMGGKGIAIQHEYIIWASKHEGQFEAKTENSKLILSKAKELISKYGGVNDTSKVEFSQWIREEKVLSGGDRAYQFLEEDGRVYQSVGMSWPNPNPAPEQFFMPLIHPVTLKPCPVPSKGWSRSPAKMKELLDKDEIIFGKDERVQPRRKIYLTKESKKPISSIISNGKKGKADLEKLGLGFSYSHPVALYEEIVNSTLFESSGYTLDYFAGSGTNFHAVMKLNSMDNGTRKCILIEQGAYVHTLIIPRIKKVAYSYDWKDGQPKNMNGLGAFVKYQRLEQYEEALENIAFTAPAGAVQQALTFDEYLPKYFLEFETRGSKSLVNVSAMQNPWGYTLKVWDGYTYGTEQPADLVETFNYLIGLHMQKHITREHKGRRYTFVWGHNNAQKKSLIIWRDTTGWQPTDYDQDRDYIVSQLEQFEQEQLYINGQSTVPGALMVEDVFKTAMIPG